MIWPSICCAGNIPGRPRSAAPAGRGLDQEEPPEIPRREFLVGAGVHGGSWRDSRTASAPRPGWSRPSDAHPAATVMPDYGESLEPEGTHDLDLIRRHGALAIVHMPSPPCGFRVAIAAKIGRDNGEPLDHWARPCAMSDGSADGRGEAGSPAPRQRWRRGYAHLRPQHRGEGNRASRYQPSSSFSRSWNAGHPAGRPTVDDLVAKYTW